MQDPQTETLRACQVHWVKPIQYTWQHHMQECVQGHNKSILSYSCAPNKNAQEFLTTQ